MYPEANALIGILLLIASVLFHLRHWRRARRLRGYARFMRDRVFSQGFQADRSSPNGGDDMPMMLKKQAD